LYFNSEIHSIIELEEEEEKKTEIEGIAVTDQ
jgi:hypothetical protein